jgi:hypothetical protein
MAPHLGHLRPPISTVSLSASAIFSCLYVITYYRPVLGAGMVDGPGVGGQTHDGAFRPSEEVVLNSPFSRFIIGDIEDISPDLL